MNKNVIYAALMFVVTMSSGNASAQRFLIRIQPSRLMRER